MDQYLQHLNNAVDRSLWTAFLLYALTYGTFLVLIGWFANSFSRLVTALEKKWVLEHMDQASKSEADRLNAPYKR